MPPGIWSRTGAREERQKLRDDVPKLGFKASDRAAAACSISPRRRWRSREAGLARRRRLDADGHDETRYLAPLQEYRRARHHAGGGAAGEIPRAVGRHVEPVFKEYAY